MNKLLIKIGALLGAASVGIGAFAAHGLKNHLTEYGANIFDTAVKYMYYHTFAILLAGILCASFNNKWCVLAGKFFLAGIIVFSGSLMMLALNNDLKWLGAITPIGGLCFIVGWLLLFLSVVKSDKV